MQKPQIEFITSNIDKEALVMDNKYIYNFIRKDKNNRVLKKSTNVNQSLKLKKIMIY